MNEDSNSAKGRDSFDITTGNTLVHFFNRNVTPYATSTLGPSFDLIPVEKQKDIMVNVPVCMPNKSMTESWIL